MTKKELKKALDAKGIDYPSGATNAELEALLNASPEAAPAPKSKDSKKKIKVLRHPVHYQLTANIGDEVMVPADTAERMVKKGHAEYV